MKKGTYIVGDMCYILNDSIWNRVCDTILEQEGHFNFGFFGKEDIKGWWHSTAYGDGNYDYSVCVKTNIKNTTPFYGFGVDAGLIGILPIEILDTDLVEKTLNKDNIIENSSLMVIEIDRDFEPKYEDGIFKFGELEIYTSYEDEEFDDEEDN